MAVAGKHICPQCFFENPLQAENCQLCGWNMVEASDDETRFVPQSSASDEYATILAPVNQHVNRPNLDDKTTAVASEFAHTFQLTGNLAHFEVNQIIGKGGMGAIYRATDHTLERQVAIKALKANRNLDQMGRDLLLEEARTLCKLNHPNIVTVYDVARGDDNHFIIMEWVDGEPLDKLIPADGFELATAINYAQQIVHGLLSAHQQRIIHSDIKPQNIMLGQDGSIKILDFGIAQLSQEHVDIQNQYLSQALAQTQASKINEQSDLKNQLPQVNGTAGYMSPEQVLGVGQLDERSDIFAFGIVFYQLLTGKPPFSGKNGKQKNAAVITGDYPALPVSVPEDIRAIVAHCLQQSPTKRYQNSQDLADDLHAYLTGEPVSVIHRKGYWFKKKTLKHKWPVMLFLLALLASSGFLVWQQLEAANQAFREELLTRFISRVETLEANVQMSKMAPAHDTSAETARWYQQIEAIKQESEALGEQATGAAGYAIGRMYYALQNYDQALYYLQQAWNNGFTESRVAYNLALTHGAIYQRQKALIANLSSNSAKQDRTAKLDQAHKQPAIDYLNQGLQGSPYFSYTQALLQYYQGDYVLALQTLNDAQDLPTWFYDHIILQGDIYLAKAEAKGGAHGDDDVEKNAALALQYYDQAAELGRSDLQLQLKPLDVYLRLLNNDLYGDGKAFDTLYQQTQPYLDKAQAIAPQDHRSYLVKGQMLSILTDYQDQFGGDAIASSNSAFSYLQSALAFSPNNPNILYLLATVRRQLVHLKLNLNILSDSDISEAIDLFNKIPEVSRDYFYYNSLASLLRVVAITFQQEVLKYRLNGVNNEVNEDKMRAQAAQALVYFDQAIDAYKKASKLKPDRVGAVINLASLYRLWAQYQLPELAKESLTQAISIYQQARTLNPEHFVVNYYLAISYRRLAQINNQLYLPNAYELEQVKTFYTVAHQAQPNHPFLQGLEALYEADQAIYLWQQGDAISQRLDSAIEDLENEVRSKPDNQTLADNLAYVLLLNAQISFFEDDLDEQLISKALEVSENVNQGSGRPEFILLQLLLGNTALISQVEIEQLQTENIHFLARAEWYSQSHQFELAEYNFDQVNQYYLSILWLYRYQHLNRWLEFVKKQNSDNKEKGAQEKISLLLKEINKIKKMLIEHYPELSFANNL